MAMSGPVGRLSMPGFQFGGSGRQARHSGEDPAGIDLHRDVVLRLELMTSSEVRWSSVISLVISGVIIWSCIALSIVQHKQSSDNGEGAGFSHKHYFVSTLVISAVLCVLVLSLLLLLTYRIWVARKRGMRWAPRRKRLVTITYAITLIQVMNLSFWMGSAGYQTADACHWTRIASNVLGYLQWSMLNAIMLLIVCAAHDMSMHRQLGHDPSPDRLVMDVGWRVHAPKLLLWAVLQALLSLTFWQLTKKIIKGSPSDQVQYDCVFYSDSCKIGEAGKIFFLLAVLFILLYIVVFIYYLWRVRRDLHKKAYAEMRLARVLWYFQMRQMLPTFLTLIITVLVLMLPHLGECWNYVLIWMGPVPTQAGLTQTAVGLAFAFAPKNPRNQDQILSAWLHEFAWTEEDKPGAIRRRNAHMHGASRLDAEPMFCIETAIKLLFWADLVYDFGLEQASEGVMKTAMGLYPLEEYEFLWDQETDTKALLAWGPSVVLLTFAGTSSLANVRTNINVHAMAHPPRRRRPGKRVGGILRVHKGFYSAYTGSGYNTVLMGKIKALLDARGGPAGVQMYLTGHSLGGALTTLAAHEIVQLVPGANIVVYTFGAPRVGCKSWALEYNSLIRDHFAVICNQDPIPRIPKGFSYKRVGVRVVMDQGGNLMVHPSPLETTMWNFQGGYVGDHFAGQYRISLASIIKAQFGKAALHGGLEGAEALAGQLDCNAALLTTNCDLDSLRDPEKEPVPLEVVARRAKRSWLSERLCLCSDGGGADVPAVKIDKAEGATRPEQAPAPPGARPSCSVVTAVVAPVLSGNARLEQVPEGGSPKGDALVQK